jgi:hypothetical protein
MRAKIWENRVRPLSTIVGAMVGALVVLTKIIPNGERKEERELDDRREEDRS